jgi:hypothetical protein
VGENPQGFPARRACSNLGTEVSCDGRVGTDTGHLAREYAVIPSRKRAQTVEQSRRVAENVLGIQ